MRRDAVLGGAVHLVRADLDFQGLAVRADHRRVQRLVYAEARLGDVVLEPAGHRLPQRVHDAHGGVAVTHVVDEDADADQVVDVVEVAAADDHLLVDRVVVLGAALDLGVDAGLFEVGGQLAGDLLQVRVARRRAGGDEADDLVVLLGLQDGERQVLELPLDRGHAEPVRERRQDLEGLAGLLRLLLGRQEAHGAHVVQAVGELDDQHPGVPRHGDDHLADGLGLGGAAELHLVQLGHAVDEARDLLPEVLLEVGEGVVGVLDGVVQERGHERDGVHAQLTEDGRDGERVGDVRVTGLAPLAAVGLLGDVVGMLEQGQVRLGVQLAVDGREWLQHLLDRGRALRRDPPGEASAYAPRRGRRSCGGG